jgi:hypothetical protein
MHLVLFVKNRERFIQAEHIDEKVSAELPDPLEDPELSELVRTHIIHNPCGPEYNENAPCCGKHPDSGNIYCTNRSPKPRREETLPGEHGSPKYRRRCRRSFEKVVKDRTVMIDDSWVVSYNPYLLKRYKAHINVEVCQRH